MVSDCLAYLKKSFSDQVVFDTFIEAQRLQISSLRTDAIEILIEGPRCPTEHKKTKLAITAIGLPEKLFQNTTRHNQGLR